MGHFPARGCFFIWLTNWSTLPLRQPACNDTVHYHPLFGGKKTIQLEITLESLYRIYMFESHNIFLRHLCVYKNNIWMYFGYKKFKCNLTCIRMVTLKKRTCKYWWGCGEPETLLDCWWGCKMVQQLWKTAWQFLNKLKIKLPHYPPISLLGICPKELKAGAWRDTCTLTFEAALFITDKRWKQPKCPKMDERINKTWYIQTMGFYLASERDNLTHATTCVDPEDIC